MRRKKLRRFEEIKEFKNVFEAKGFLKRNSEGALSDNKVLSENNRVLRENFSTKALAERWSDLLAGGKELILELGCGKGDFAVAMGEMFPEKLIIGVDRKGERIWCGARAALEKGLDNVVFLRCGIEKLENFFVPQSVAHIWITFPDPFPGSRRAHRRLTSRKFLAMYRRLLRGGGEDAKCEVGRAGRSEEIKKSDAARAGRIFLKTDSRELLEYSEEMLEAHGFELLVRIDDVYGGSSGNFQPFVFRSGAVQESSLENILRSGAVQEFFKKNLEVLPALQIQTAFERRHLAAKRKIGFLAAVRN